MTGVPGCSCELNREGKKPSPCPPSYISVEVIGSEQRHVSSGVNKIGRNWAGWGLGVTGKPLTGDIGAM